MSLGESNFLSIFIGDLKFVCEIGDSEVYIYDNGEFFDQFSHFESIVDEDTLDQVSNSWLY